MKTILAALAFLFLFACASPDGSTGQPTPMPIAGRYMNSEGQLMLIAQAQWYWSGTVLSISRVDIPHSFAEVHFPTSWGPYFFNWTISSGITYVCFNQDPNAPVSSDLITGCLGKPWDMLTPAP